MRKTYRILADIIAIEVVIQAMVMVFAIAGLFKWISDGATLDQSVIDGGRTTLRRGPARSATSSTS